MIGFENILSDELEGVKTSLIEEYVKSGRKAYGNWANELEVVTSIRDGGLIGEIKGAHYTIFMEQGRKRNSNKKNRKGFAAWASGSGGFITKWCQSKGIDENAAFPIALKIAREGYEGKPLVGKVVSKQLIDGIVRKIGNGILKGVESDVIKQFKEWQ